MYPCMEIVKFFEKFEIHLPIKKGKKIGKHREKNSEGNVGNIEAVQIVRSVVIVI